MNKYLKELKPLLNVKCIIWALIFVILLVSYAPSLIFTGESKEVTFTLLEEMNPSCQGCEAWIGFEGDVEIVSMDTGWSSYNNGYLAVTPNRSLVVKLPAGTNIINLGKHQYARKLAISWDDNVTKVDLYSSTIENYDFSIRVPWKFEPSFYKIALIFALFVVCLFATVTLNRFFGIKIIAPLTAAVLFLYSYPKVSENWLIFAYVLVSVLSIYYLWKNKYTYVKEYRKSKLLNTLIIILACYTAFAFWGFELFLSSDFMTFTTESIFAFISLSIFTVYLIYAIISFYEKFKNKLESKSCNEQKTCRIKLISFGIIAVTTTLWCLIFAPGNMTSDNVDQWLQAAGCYPIYNAHPAIHTILLRITSAAAKTPLVYIILQSILFAYITASFFGILYKKGAPKKLLVILSIIIGAAPPTAAMLTCSSKNILFAILIFWLTIQILDMFDNPRAFFKSPLKMIEFVIAIAFNYLIRHNTFVFLPIVIAVCIFFSIKLYRSVKLKPVICVTVAMLITQLITGPIYDVFDVQRSEGGTSLPTTSLILPFTTAVKFDLPLSEETLEYLEKILPLEEYAKRYSPYNGDIFGWSEPRPTTAKITTGEALGQYLKFLVERPDIVIKSRLDGVNLTWDVFSHTGVNHDRYALGIWGPAHLSDYADEFPNVFYPDRESGEDVYTLAKGYPKILKDFISYFNQNDVLNAIFWRNGIYVILALLCIIIAIKEKKYRVIIAILPAFAILATLILVISWQIYQYVYFFPLCTMVVALYLLFDSRQSCKENNGTSSSEEHDRERVAKEEVDSKSVAKDAEAIQTA